MEKMNRKWSAFVVFLIINLALINACSAFKTEPVEFSMLYNQKDSAPFQEDWLILKEYEKRKKVRFDVRIGDDADYDKAVQQTFESGDLPDIILKAYPMSIEHYAVKGLLLPFSDYEEQMPFLQAYIQEHDLEDELDKLRLENGKYYILPGYQRQIQVQQWVYRRDLFEKHQLGIPDTYDELLDDMTFLKENYPEVTPMTSLWEGAHLLAMIGAGYGIPAGWNGVQYYDEEEKLWYYAPATENYREMLAYLKRCYEANIFDPETFTQSDLEYMQKIEDGRAIYTPSWITSGFSAWNEKLRANGIPDGEWAPMPVPESTIGMRALPPVNPFRKGLIVPARVINEPYFEKLIAFLDWAVYSEEGMTLSAWGVQGVTYETIPSGKIFMPEIATPKNPQGHLDITMDFGLYTFFDLNENEEYEDYKKPDEIVTFLDRSLAAGETLRLAPDLKLDVEQIDAAQLILDKLDPYANEMLRAFIIGEMNPDEDWDTYIAELEKRGYRTVEEIWNIAWRESK